MARRRETGQIITTTIIWFKEKGKVGKDGMSLLRTEDFISI